MRLKHAASLWILLALHNLNGIGVAGQTPDTGWEVRPKLTDNIDLLARTRLQTWVELQHGVNFSFQRWRSGGIIIRRLKPILKQHRHDIDEDYEHYLVFGGGYEYLHTVQNGSTKIENRIIAQATPRILFAGFLLSDRNRGEFRWVNGIYDFRYRNKVEVMNHLQRGVFRFTPYVSGELY